MISLYRRLIFTFGVFTLCLLPITGLGDDGSSIPLRPEHNEPEEVFLTFNYRNLFNKVVVTLYEDGKFYLPISDVLETLEIPHEVKLSPAIISGSYAQHFPVPPGRYGFHDLLCFITSRD